MKRTCTIVSLLLFASCLTTDNPYDPENPDYTLPSFSIDSSLTTVFDGDTIGIDSATIALLGNDVGNQFRWRLDSTEWHGWHDSGSVSYTIRLGDIDTGMHSVDIQTCYSPDGDITDTTLHFYRASAPHILAAADSLFDLDAGAGCTLWVQTGGTPELSYAWYRGDVPVDTSGSDTLVLPAVSAGDSGLYVCVVSNPWGTAVSDTFAVYVSRTFALVYDANGATDGAVPADTTRHQPGDSVTVLANSGALVNGGRTFEGWNTRADGSGETYVPGVALVMGDSAVVLYAQWDDPATYSLVYSGNGNTDGAVPVDSNAYDAGAEITVRGNTGDLVKTGHTFGGWNTAPDGSGETYAPGSPFTMGASEDTLYAAWVADTFTIVFDTDEGSVVADQKIAYGELATEPTEPRRTGFTFEGWFTDDARTDQWAFTEDTVTADDTLYAKWTLSRYTVTLNAQGGTEVAPQTVDHGGLVTEPDTPLRIAHRFEGWFRSPTGISRWDFASEQVTEDVTIYAQWSTQMVLIPAKDSSFMMGSETGDSIEQPVHQVTFTYDFWMDTTEVTQKDYEELMSATYAEFTLPDWGSPRGDNYPAYWVSWFDAARYCNARTKARGSTDTVYTYYLVPPEEGGPRLDNLEFDLTRSGYRLPIEAEWEYACRAGTRADFYWGQGAIDEYAWHVGNSDTIIQPVACKLPNSFGLYDMSGNISEWCNESRCEYSADPVTVPAELCKGTSWRVLRGGDWFNEEPLLRSSARNEAPLIFPNGGIRVVLPVPKD